MTELVPYDPAVGRDMVWRNVVATFHGLSKTGKTHFTVRSQRPLYVAFLDPNATLDYHILKADAEDHDRWPAEEVYPLVVPRRPYADLTGPAAEGIIANVQAHARAARQMASERVAQGLPGGTFLVDGALMLKGYWEKAVLGESATLGYRAKKGERGGPSRFEYGTTNTMLEDFVAEFGNSDVDFIMTWESKELYTGDGDPRGIYASKMPTNITYAVNVLAEMLMVEDKRVIANKERTFLVPSIRVGHNSFSHVLFDQVVKAGGEGFEGFKKMLLVDVPEQEGTE